MGKHISRFNPSEMSREEVLLLATGRDNLLESLLSEMRTCLDSEVNQQFIIYGPRGIGKSFFIKLLSVHHQDDPDFSKSMFINFPEEQGNIEFVADVLDMLSVKLEGGYFQSVMPRWEIADEDWQKSIKRFKGALESIKESHGITHVFFTMENLQEFIPRLDATENGRLREVLEKLTSLTMIGTSIRPDMDNDYNSKLFQVFKKFELEPWGEEEFLTYYRKKLSNSRPDLVDSEQDLLSQARIKAIAQFSGGSPRLAVILNSLIIDDDIMSTADILGGIVDELTPYYQDLTKDIPRQSAKLFDLLIRLGENVTQSELAEAIGKQQKTIARSFKWLIDNFYVNAQKQKQANVKHYYVRDRLYVLYYQNRETMRDKAFSFVEAFTDLLVNIYRPSQIKDRAESLFDSDASKARVILSSYMKKVGLSCNPSWTDEVLVKEFGKNADSAEISYLHSLAMEGQIEELESIINKRGDKLTNPLLPCILSTAWYANKDYIKTLFYSDNTLGLLPDFVPALLLKSYSLFSLKRFEQTIDCCIKIVELYPDIVDAEDFIRIFGSSYMAVREYDKASNLYLKSFEVTESSHMALMIALCNHRKGDIEKSLKYISVAIEMQPTDKVILRVASEIHLSYCEALIETQKFEEALVTSKKAISLDSDTGGQVLIAVIYFMTGEIDLYLNAISTFDDDRLVQALVLPLMKYKERNIFFQQALKVISLVEEHFDRMFISFLGVLCHGLFGKNRFLLLEDLVQELRMDKSGDPLRKDSLGKFLSIWEYLLNPSEKDLASLHPDARVVVDNLLRKANESKEQEK